MVDGKADLQSTQKVRTHGSKLELNEETFLFQTKKLKIYCNTSPNGVQSSINVYIVCLFLMFSMLTLCQLSFYPDNKIKSKNYSKMSAL